MKYALDNDLTRTLGIGSPGDVRQGPDGQLYGWVEAADGLGNISGFWSKLKKIAKVAMPIAKMAAGFVPGMGPALTAVETAGKATGLLGPADPQVAEALGIGAPGDVVQGPDGQLYGWVEMVDGIGEIHGFWSKLKKVARAAMPIAKLAAGFIPGASSVLTAAEVAGKATGILGADEMQVAGSPGDVIQGPDGQLYGWVEAVDGLGNIHGFWSKLKKIAKVAMPIAKLAAGFVPIPGVSTAVNVADQAARAAGLYGVAEDQIYGEEPVGAPDYTGDVGADEPVSGWVGDDPVQGYDGPDDMQGYEGEEPVSGPQDEVGAEEQVMGPEPVEGYLPDDGIRGYVPEQPEQTQWVQARPVPANWRRPW